MTDIIVIALVVLAVAGASFYIYKAKKSGQKCIGCPYGKKCTGSCSCKGSEKDN